MVIFGEMGGGGDGWGNTAQVTPIQPGAKSYMFHEVMGHFLVPLAKGRGGGGGRGGGRGGGGGRGDFGSSILRIIGHDRMSRPSMRTRIYGFYWGFHDTGDRCFRFDIYTVYCILYTIWNIFILFIFPRVEWYSG